MNIKQAKEQVRKTCIAYLTKDEFGEYVMPVEAQRPIFLLGAPGIGKTAIMAQVAAELDLGLVDYSMTHHTRQSAIGLPFITKRSFGGHEADISEYTMSEIIASIYESIEQTGWHEGILFLDEINCVSETLMPMMLRFLQSKMLGNHRVPDGWVIVSAGNPLEYNKSARTFDVVTMDRVKRIEVEPDLAAWREYAVANGVHPAVASFLDMRPDCFYHMETKGRTREFVTARAWSDLSTMMRLYEANELKIDDELIGQYIQDSAIAADFCVYLRLFASYTTDYRIDEILEGAAGEELVSKAAAAGFDEKAALTGLFVDALAAHAASCVCEERQLAELRRLLIDAKTADDAACVLDAAADEREKLLEADAARLRNDAMARSACHGIIATARQWVAQMRTGGATLRDIASSYNERLTAYKAAAAVVESEIDAALAFVDAAWGAGNEMTIALNEMTMNRVLSAFIAKHDCSAYYDRSEMLMLDARAQRLAERLAALEA